MAVSLVRHDAVPLSGRFATSGAPLDPERLAQVLSEHSECRYR